MVDHNPANDSPHQKAERPPSQSARDEEFIRLLTNEQISLNRYLLTLLGDHDAAANVLQETNLVIWRKADQFEPGTSFSAWSRKIAYWQTLAYLRDRTRDRHVFSEELVGQLAVNPAIESNARETRVALRHCLGELPDRQLELIRQRYGSELSIDRLAERVGAKPGAIKVRLHRIRRILQNCIEKQTALS